MQTLSSYKFPFFVKSKEWTFIHFYKINIIVYFQYVGGFIELKKIELDLILVKWVQSKSFWLDFILDYSV